MALIQIDEAPELVVLAEVRQAIYIAMEALNRKRRLYNTGGFAAVRVSEIAAPAITEHPSFVVEFSDSDRAVPRYVARELKSLAGLSRQRLALLAEASGKKARGVSRYTCCS